MAQPLAGVRILAVEQMQSLPYATQLLGRLGADVVKIEHPTRGDLGRSSFPAITDRAGASMGATFLRNNQNKRSLGLDLKKRDAQALFMELAGNFDVVAENFKPGGMTGFGLDYAAVATAHPSIVYLSVSGFGNTVESPYGHWPAFAPVAEAMAGLYAFNRGPDEPAKVSPAGALGDTGTGLFAVIGVLAALRQRDSTGQGSYVDISMFDAMVAFADVVPNYWSLGKDPRTPTAMINHSFPVASGELVIQVGREHQFERLAETVGHPEWITDARFQSREGWLANLEDIRTAVRVWAGDRSPVEAADALAAAGIACSPIFEAADLVADPHVQNRNMLARIERPEGGDPVLTPGNPVKISNTSDVDTSGPPTLGEHTDSILKSELGITNERLEELRAAGAIG